jgi:hypothetical protein
MATNLIWRAGGAEGLAASAAAASAAADERHFKRVVVGRENTRRQRRGGGQGGGCFEEIAAGKFGMADFCVFIDQSFDIGCNVLIQYINAANRGNSFLFHAAVPILKHFLGGRNFQRAG